VDVHTYELCSDLVDVVVDVSQIYGMSEGSENAITYDDESASAIRLNSGMVLYLRSVSNYLALVCVLSEEYFAKRSILDYNINCFKDSLEKLFKKNEGSSHGSTR
jgi:Ras-related GTP-binding protein C/D